MNSIRHINIHLTRVRLDKGSTRRGILVGESKTIALTRYMDATKLFLTSASPLVTHICLLVV